MTPAIDNWVNGMDEPSTDKYEECEKCTLDNKPTKPVRYFLPTDDTEGDAQPHEITLCADCLYVFGKENIVV